MAFVGAIVSGIGLISSGNAQKAIYNAQAQAVLRDTEAAIDQNKAKAARLRSTQRTIIGASGLSAESVTADEIVASTDFETAYENELAKESGSIRAALLRESGRQAQIGSRFAAAGNLLTAAAGDAFNIAKLG